MSEFRLALLGLLRHEGLYGYQLRDRLEQGELSGLPMAPGDSLVQGIGELVDAGLLRRSGVEASGGRALRMIYHLTDLGRQELRRVLIETWLSDDPLAEALASATLFLDALPSSEIIATLDGRLQRLQGQIRGLDQAEGSTRSGSTPGARALTARKRLRLEMEAEWTRDLIARARSGEFGPKRAGSAPKPSGTRPPTPKRDRGQGAFTLVLHSHLPYCRMAGRWPHGEEWIHEAAAETYIPLLNALYDLYEEGVSYRLTVGLTPVLVEQLADADVCDHLLLYLDEEIAAAERDIPRFGEEGEAHAEHLARFYRDTYNRVKDSFETRFKRDIVGAFRHLQDLGYLEIVTCAATHGYLPLLARDSSIYGQLRTGVESYRRHFGRSPRAIWLPECAYRPAYVDHDGTVRPAIEEFLSTLGLGCFFAETHAVEGGRPVGKAAGDVAIGPYVAIKRRYVIPMAAEDADPGGTTSMAYYVVGSDHGLTDPPVAVIARNNSTGQQVWSADWGYPGDADYREFHKKDHETGLQYWRVTGPRVDLGDKDYYHPDWAESKVGGHADHYASLLEDVTRTYHGATGRYGIVASNYDTELFGHWWFEGIEWIKRVLRRLAESDVVDMTTASDYVEQHEPEQVLALPESSWGTGGTHWTWDNQETNWLWVPIHEAEERMEELVTAHPDAKGGALEALNQAARELLLLEASDWPFLVTTGQAKQYAVERFHGHLDRFEEIAGALEGGNVEHAAALAAEYYEVDNVFPDIDYRWFQARQGRAD